MKIRIVLMAGAIALAATTTAWAELAVSANDGHQLRAGDPVGVTPDNVTVVDMGHWPPRALGTVAAPASIVGPPAAVAVSRDEKFAIVTASTRIDPADQTKAVPDDRVSVIDLSDPKHPKLSQSLTAGPGTAGVSINHQGTLALVASSGDDSIHVFSIADGKLTPAGALNLGAKSRPTDVVFAPDGRHAYAIAQGEGKVVELAVDGTTLSKTGNDIASGRQPYGAVVTPDGAWLVNTNLGGSLDSPAPVPGVRGPRIGSISLIDLTNHKLAASADVGVTPEHVGLSPDGRYAAVVVANGTAFAKSDPSFDKVLGILRIFRIEGGALIEVAHTDTGHWCQGTAWSNSGKRILLQCATERALEAYRFDGQVLTRDVGAGVALQSRPASIATARSR
jgi:DNA-binding beta-propeller fold protein YncE